MKLISLLTALLSFCFIQVHSQVPGIKWSKNITSQTIPLSQGLYEGKPTSDKGFILVGADSSFYNITGDYIDKLEAGRPWIVKVDSAGNKVWQNFFLNNSSESAFTSVSDMNSTMS